MNNNFYWYIGADQFDNVESWGYSKSDPSCDGQLMCIDNNSQEDISHLINTPPKPPYANVPNWPRASCSEAQAVVSTETTDGTVTTGYGRAGP